jgi:hypothetical protein
MSEIKNIFSPSITDEITARLQGLTQQTTPKWGKMDAAQMLAHLNVQYEMLYETIHKPIPGVMRFMLKTFVKRGVVNDVPYKRNSGTAPIMVIKTPRDFQKEKTRFILYLNRVSNEGSHAFFGRKHMAFGALTSDEWNNLFYKHIDHHLTQFGV